MKRQFSKVLGIQKPVDGYTTEERAISDLLCNAVIDEIYAKLPTSRMKAIVALHFQNGYDTYTLAKIFGVKQPQIALDIRNIKKVLTGQQYRPHKAELNYNITDIMWLFMHLSNPN